MQNRRVSFAVSDICAVETRVRMPRHDYDVVVGGACSAPTTRPRCRLGLASISSAGGQGGQGGDATPPTSASTQTPTTTPRRHLAPVNVNDEKAPLSVPTTPEQRVLHDPPMTPRQLKIRADSLNHAVDSHAIRLTRQSLNDHTKALEKVMAFVGSLVLAGVSKAAHHVSSHYVFRNRDEKDRVNPSFSNSFSMPWKHHHHQEETSKTRSELAASIASRGLDYERGLDVRAAVQCFEEAVKLHPDDLIHLCMAAKQWSDLTFFHDVTTDRERQVVNRKAIEFAERAVASHPQSPGGYLGLCVAKGRLALFTDNKTKVKLAKEAHEAAHRAVELGPENDIAWHVTGRWHAEMAKLNVVVRTIVKVMYGTALESGSKEDALQAYKRAIELAPERLIHYVEAGRVLMDLNRKEEARKYLEASLEKDVEDINAWQTRHDAEELLAKLAGRRWVRPSNTPPNVPDRRDHTKFSTTALLGDHPLANDLSDDSSEK